MNGVKTIVVSIQNGLLNEAIIKILSESGEFNAIPAAKISKNGDISESCKLISADMTLMSVSNSNGDSIEKRLKEINDLRESLPDCKIALMCDENTYPELANEVTKIKRDKKIDSFFYSSVSANYLTAVLSSM